MVEKVTPFLSSPVTPDSAEKIAPHNVASYMKLREYPIKKLLTPKMPIGALTQNLMEDIGVSH